MTKPIHAVTFRIPNDKTGQRFLFLARKYINRDKYQSVRVRARKGKRQVNGHDIERDGCKAWAVYLVESEAQRTETRKIEAKRFVTRWDYDKKVAELTEEVCNASGALRLEKERASSMIDTCLDETRHWNRLARTYKITSFILGAGWLVISATLLMGHLS